MLRALLASHAFAALLLIAGCQSQPGSTTFENQPAAVPSATVTVEASPEPTDPYAELNAARIASLDDRLAQKRVQTLLPDPRQALDLQQTR